jgi:hypothetical protein
MKKAKLQCDAPECARDAMRVTMAGVLHHDCPVHFDHRISDFRRTAGQRPQAAVTSADHGTAVGPDRR